MLVGFYKVIEELKNSKEEYVTGRVSAGLKKDSEDKFKRILKENGYHDFDVDWHKNPIKTDRYRTLCDPFIEFRISTKQTEPQQKEDEESGARALLFFAMFLLVIGGILIW